MKRAHKVWLGASVAAALGVILIVTLTSSNDQHSDSSPPKRVCRDKIPGQELQHLLPNGSSLSEESPGFPKAPLSYCQVASDGQRVVAEVKRSGPFPSKREVLKDKEHPISFGRDYGYYVPERKTLRLLIPCDALPRSRSTIPLLVSADRMRGKSIESLGKTQEALLKFAGQVARAVAKDFDCNGWEKISKQPPKPVRGEGA